MSRTQLSRWVPGVLFALLLFAVWADPLFTGRTFTGRDNLAYNLPMEKVIHDAYASGRMPVWNPLISGGRPLAPNPNHGSMYPVRALLAPLPFATAIRIYPILHWLASGIGMLLLLSRLGVSPAGAFVGAATLVFGGPSVSELFYPHLQPGFTLFPWIVLAVLSARRPASAGTIALAALFGVDFLAGDVFTGALAVGIAILWVLGETPREELGSRFAALAVAAALGALVGAPQILATALWVPETNRAVLGIDLGNALRYSVSPFRLAELVIPYPFGPTWELFGGGVWGRSVFQGKVIGFFSTLFVGALAPIAVWRLRRDAAPGSRFARWLLGISLAVAILPSLTPRSWFALPSPLPLRNPEKVVVAVAFALAILAARGFDDIRRRPLDRRIAFGVGAALAVAAVAATLAPGPVGRAAAGLWGALPEHPRTAGREIPGALAEGGLLWMATVVALEGARGTTRLVRDAALLMLCLVPVAATVRTAEISNTDDALAPTAVARLVRKADPSGSFRVLGEAVYVAPDVPSTMDLRQRTELYVSEIPRRGWFMYGQTLWGVGTVFNGDFDTGDLARMEGLRKLSAFAAGYRDSTPFFGNVSLKWAVRPPERPPAGPYSLARVTGGDALDEIPAAQVYPDIRLATSWLEAPSSLAALGLVSKVGPGELLLETGRSGRGSARPGSLRIVEKTPARLVVDVDAPDRTWLFVLRNFWQHRRIEVDGRAAEGVPTYLAFTAVEIPAGRHRVDWREEIPGFAVSRWGPVVAGAAMLWLALSARRRPAKRTQEENA